MTVIEVLVTMSLMVVVMGLVLTTMESFGRSTARNGDRLRANDSANLFLGQMTREMRNGTGWGSSAPGLASPVLRATATDLVFKRVDPVKTSGTGDLHSTSTVRYCLDAKASTVHRQEKAGVAVPATACPDSSWTSIRRIGGVANASVPLFSYDNASLTDIKSIAIDLRVDDDPTRPPAAVRIQSGVALRNANRRPTAAFMAIPTPNRHVLLNATGSSDPDGQALLYTWTDNGSPIAGSGPVLDYVAPATGSRTIGLVVTDPGGLTAEASQTVSVQP